MWRAPWDDLDLINEYENAQKTWKKVDLSNIKPTWKTFWTAKTWSKKTI